MSSDSGDATNRVSDANPAPPTEPYELPTIVPATEHRADPTAATPRLPRTAGAAAPTTARVQESTPPRPVSPRPVSSAPTPAAVGPPPRSNLPPAPAAPTQPPAPFTSPASAQLRSPGRRPRVRRVTRVLRHIDPWSTFKIALVFSTVSYIVTLTSGVLLWRVADATGTLANVERWFTQFGWETFELQGGEIFHNAWIIGLFGVVAATGGAVLLVTLFNLVSDIVGGIRLTVLEEEVVERTVSSTRRYAVRSTPPAGGVAPPEWSVDDGPADAEPPAMEASDPPRTSARPAGADWTVD